MTNSSSEGNTCSSPNQTANSLKSQSQISSTTSPVFNNYNQSAIIVSPAHQAADQPENTKLIDSPYLAGHGLANVDSHANSRFNNSLKIDTQPVSAYSYTSQEKPMIRCLNSPESVKYNHQQQDLNASLSPTSLVQNRSFGMDACLNEFNQRNSEKFEV